MRVFKTLIMTLFLMGVAHTAQSSEWYTCEIDFAGTGSSNIVLFKFNDTDPVPAFTSKWFRAPENLNIEYLEIGLKAITSNKNIVIRADLSETPFPTIEQMYLTR